MERFEGDNERIIGYCLYCKDPIYDGESHICINGNYYHYDPVNPLLNCYFPEGEE
jgi:hypothetical protein